VQITMDGCWHGAPLLETAGGQDARKSLKAQASCPTLMCLSRLMAATNLSSNSGLPVTRHIAGGAS
jgi:hypothetical protein